ncbi:MAG: hypothetical protein ABIE42_09490 [Candidatus Eisenbacteria bacterium]
MRRIVLLCLATALVLVSLAAHAEAIQGIREQRPNLVFGEIGGKAIIFSAGYERYLSNRFGLGVGGVGWGASGGGIGLFPVYVSFIPVGDVHSVYLSAGVTYFAGVGNWTGDGWSDWFGTFSAGYHYQSEGGFFVRPTMNMLYKGEGFLVIPGIALGGCF